MSKKKQIEESTAKKYRVIAGYEYANIVIDLPREGAVEVFINSSFGSWTNYWGAIGDDWKKFLSGIDPHYMASKFGAQRDFDAEKTESFWLEKINECISDEGLKEELQSLVKDTIAKSSTDMEFVMLMADEDKLMELTDHDPCVCYMTNRQFMHFYNSLWKDFLDYINK